MKTPLTLSHFLAQNGRIILIYDYDKTISKMTLTVKRHTWTN